MAHVLLLLAGASAAYAAVSRSPMAARGLTERPIAARMRLHAGSHPPSTVARPGVQHAMQPPNVVPQRARPRAAAQMQASIVGDDERIKRFVLQRALQTIMFYMRTCRDTATADWLERFLELPGLDEYHGLDGLSKPWRETVTSLFAEPPTTIVVHSIPRNRAGSGNNPYLPPKVMTMDFDIVPQRIALRLLDCTAEIARECEGDLGRMSQENDQIRREYIVGKEGEATIRAGSYPTLQHEAEGTSKSAFRGGTYDLLKRLATREAVFATVRALEPKPSAQWLARYYKAHGAGFDGEARYGVAEGFLKALLAEMPSVSSDGAMVDPKSVVDVILGEREAAAARWRQQLATVPADVQDLKREFLEKGLR